LTQLELQKIQRTQKTKLNFLIYVLIYNVLVGIVLNFTLPINVNIEMWGKTA